MKIGKFAGVTLLGLLWLWLCWGMFTAPHGFTLKSIFIAVASGIIIFVPLWKKYFRKDNDKKEL